MNTKNLYYEGLGQSLLKPMNYKKQVLHSYVDLGLPSGTLWATMNIGASQPSDYGLYFAWGDTQGYTAEQVGSGEGQKNFGWADYKYGNGKSSPGDTGMTKYNATDGLTTLEAVDDAAVANWGGSWRMPTTAEFQALGAVVNTEWTQVNNVYGILCTDKTDSSKTLFFPACGNAGNGSVSDVDGSGYYWSSSLDDADYSVCYARNLNFSDGDVYWDSHGIRCGGFSVRPVIDGTPESRVVLIYNTENESEIMLSFGPLNLNLIYEDIEVDGQSILIPETTDPLNFNSLGKHTVKLTLKDPTSLVQSALHGSSATYIYLPPSITFLDYTSIAYCDKLTHVDFYDISGSATCNFVNCPNLDADTLNRLSILFPNGYGEGYCD